MKSDGVKDILEWMEKEIKEHKKGMVGYSGWDDYAHKQVELDLMIKWKISTEKYMKKLKHQGE